VSVGTDRDAYVSGDKIAFLGSVMNENAHPVVDGNIFVRVSRINPNYVKEGNNIVDEFIAKENIILAGKESIPTSFSWTVPQEIKNGSYRADFFFSVGKKFNLGGLPFTNEVIIGTARFDIANGLQSAIEFNRAQTKVNGTAYAHIGNWPVIESGAKVLIEQPITNTFRESRDVTVRYDLYFWDSLNEDDRIATETRKITLPAGATQTLSYEIPSMDESVYYLRITAESGSARSIVNARVVSDSSHPRLNYPAITKFPIKKGEAFTLFSCFHNSSGGSVSKNNTVNISLYDSEGNLIGSADYAGSIASDMSAVAKDFSAGKNYDYARLIARISDANGKVMDRYEVVYDCKDFGGCTIGKGYGFSPTSIITPKKVGIGIVVVLFLIGIVLIVLHRRGRIASK